MPYVVSKQRPKVIMEVANLEPYLNPARMEYWKWRKATPKEVWKWKHRMMRVMISGGTYE